MLHGRKIAVIGLGYVGLPVAVAFGRAGAPVIGFDIDPQRVHELNAGHDRTREVAPGDLRAPALTFTAEEPALRGGRFLHRDRADADRRCPAPGSRRAARGFRRPSAGRCAWARSWSTSPTVYPGATEEDCVPALEQASGLKAGRDFAVGYSPERINPGDTQHRFESITKVVAGQDAETLEIIAAVYGSVVTAGIHKAPSIKVAEAAKVIENTQRDLNIALMNELSSICHLLEIDTADVLAAARTKWNFMPFTPGLVGGHCIGVDPYYLTHRAEKAGYHPEVILAGRRINDGVGQRVARECLRRMMRNGSASKLVTILGLTFKENVPDVRNSKVVDIVSELRSFGATVQVHDPLATASEVRHEYGIELMERDADRSGRCGGAGGAAPSLSGGGLGGHRAAAQERARPCVDVKAQLDRAQKPDSVELWRL